MSKYEIDVWEYADEFKNLDTNETFYGYQVCELLEHKDQQISDLEAKLAEAQKTIEIQKMSNNALQEENLDYRYDITDTAYEQAKYMAESWEEDYQQEITELKQQLVESEKSKESYRLQNEQHHLQLLQFYSRLGVEAFGADIHEKALETLMIMKDQLAEKEKEISEYIKIVDDLHKQLSDKCDFCDKTKDQDKISFAVEQLEKVKEIINKNYFYNLSNDSCTFDKLEVDFQINNQIKQLNEGK